MQNVPNVDIEAGQQQVVLMAFGDVTGLLGSFQRLGVAAKVDEGLQRTAKRRRYLNLFSDSGKLIEACLEGLNRVRIFASEHLQIAVGAANSCTAEWIA